MGTELTNLVAFHDKELITTSSIVAEVFGMRHDNVLQAIENLKGGLTALPTPRVSPENSGDTQTDKSKIGFIPEERLLKIQESSEEHQRKIALMVVQPEERRREFGEGAGKLISEPAQTPQHPTEWDMLLAQAYDKTVERERNEIDSSKRQYFRRVDVVVDLGMGRSRLSHEYEMNRDGFFLLAMGFTGPKALEFKVQFIQEFNRLEHIAYDKLLEDSEKLHQIQDQSRLQEMEWRLQTLEGEKQKLSRQVEFYEDPKNPSSTVRQDIRHTAARDVARIFFPSAKVALSALGRAKLLKSSEKMQGAITDIEGHLYKSLSKIVDIANKHGMDLELQYDDRAMLEHEVDYAAYAAECEARRD